MSYDDESGASGATPGPAAGDQPAESHAGAQADVDPAVALAVGQAVLRMVATSAGATSEVGRAAVQVHNAGKPALEAGYDPVTEDQVQAPEALSTDQLRHAERHPEDFQLHNAGRPAVQTGGGQERCVPAERPFAEGNEPAGYRAEDYRLESGRWVGPSD